MSKPSIISFFTQEEKYIIYRKSFWCERLWVYEMSKFEEDPMGLLHQFPYTKLKVVWTDPIQLLKDYSSRDKKTIIQTETSSIALKKLKHYWKIVKFFPGIFGSYLDQYKNYEMKTYTFRTLKEDNAEYFFINNK